MPTYLLTLFEGKAVGWRATQSHASLGGSGGMPPRKIFKKMKKNGAISCILRPQLAEIYQHILRVKKRKLNMVDLQYSPIFIFLRHHDHQSRFHKLLTVQALHVCAPGADPGFLKGGGGSRRGYRIFQKHPPPLDIVRVTSSALMKFEKHPPLLDIHKHPPPPLDIARVTSSTFQGGRGDHPCHTHTPWIRHWGPS